MTLTKSRQAYVAILVIGVVALVIDRTLLQPEPAEASAWQYAISPSTREPIDPGSPRSEGPAPRQVAIARRLEQIAEQRGLDPIGGWAIVDGRTLFIGQVLDGFTLVSVGRRSAVLESGDARVVLTLPD